MPSPHFVCFAFLPFFPQSIKNYSQTQKCTEAKFFANIFCRRTVSRRLFHRYYSSTLPSSQEYDVVIVGGGMVGGTLARALRTSKFTSELKIAVLDPQHATVTMKEPLPTPDIRCSALTKASVRLFDQIGLSEIFAFASSSPFYRMQIWDELNSGAMQFSATDSASTTPNDAMGFIVDNQVITHHVWKALKQDAEQNPEKLNFYAEKVMDINLNQSTPTITEWQTKLSNIQAKTSNLASITLSNGTQLQARLIVAADGPFSNCREYLGMKTMSWNYGKQAVVCCVQTEPSALPKTAYQRFLKTGPIALLPMGNDYHNIVWSTDVDHAKYLLSLNSQDFLHALQLAFDTKPTANEFEQTVANAVSGPLQAAQGAVSQALTSFPLIQGIVASANVNAFMNQGFAMPRIANIVHNGKRASFPLRRLHATEYVKSRFALVGYVY